MQITYDHLKTLYDLLAMQQAELLLLTTTLRQRDSQLEHLQHQQTLPAALPVSENGLRTVLAD